MASTLPRSEMHLTVLGVTVTLVEVAPKQHSGSLGGFQDAEPLRVGLPALLVKVSGSAMFAKQ